MKKINQHRKTYSRATWLFLTGLVVTIFAISCADTSQKTEDAPGDEVAEETALTPVQEGAEYFQSYCTMCHGEDAKGVGTMAAKLDVTPPDLTAIAQRRNGIFPDQVITDIVAGEKTMLGHGDGEMPDWRVTFRKSENIFNDSIVQEKIEHIVAYLKTIQQ